VKLRFYMWLVLWMAKRCGPEIRNTILAALDRNKAESYDCHVDPAEVNKYDRAMEHLKQQLREIQFL